MSILSEEEEKLYDLTSEDADYKVVHFLVQLNKEQIIKLKTHKGRYRNGRLYTDMVLEPLGCVDPTKIELYFCPKCCENYLGPPDVSFIILEEKFSGTSDIIGYCSMKCKVCSHSLHIGYVHRGDNPKPEYIKKPNPCSIEELIKKAEKSAEMGDLNAIDLRLAMKFASQVGYELDDNRLGTIESTDEKKKTDFYRKYISKNAPKTF